MLSVVPASCGAALPATSIRPLRGVLRAAAVLLSLMLLAAAPAAGQAYVYWGSTSGKIGRANLDGTGVSAGFMTGLGAVSGVAVDTRHIYWTEQDNDRIGRANLDGTGVNASFITGASAPRGIAVDANHIWWANSGSWWVARANLDGTGVNQTLLSVMNPQDVEVNADHLYVAAYGLNRIVRAGLDGSDAEPDFITAASPFGIAADTTHIYWTPLYEGTAIGRANLDGTGVNGSLFTGGVGPAGIALTAGHVYWSDFVGNTIGRAGLDGTAATQSLISGLSTVAAVDVTAPRVQSAGADFGSQAVATHSAALPVAVTNTGEVPLTIANAVIGAGGTRPADFSIISDGCSGTSTQPGQSCLVHVRYTPTLIGDVTAELVLTDDAEDSPQRLPLAGTGIPAPAGPAGPAGAPGPIGPAGPPGRNGADGLNARLVVVIARTTVTSRRATVRYALTGAAKVVLRVRPASGGETRTVSRATGKAGINTIAWNRRLDGRPARPSRYRLTVAATAGGGTTTNSATVRLR